MNNKDIFNNEKNDSKLNSLISENNELRTVNMMMKTKYQELERNYTNMEIKLLKEIQDNNNVNINSIIHLK